MANTNLHAAKKAKNDEFYTRLEDIENELKHYKKHFKDKTVFLNCDDPKESMFWKYFQLNFNYLGLKKLVSTHYDEKQPTYKLEIYRRTDGVYNVPDSDIIKTPLKQNGDFRSDEAIEILKEADIVVTNPPFSLFREYIAQLMEYDKKFLVLGNNNSITYKEIFPLIKDNELWLGVTFNKTMEFRLPDEYLKWDRVDGNGNKYGKVPAISWFTNLEHHKRNEKLKLVLSYDEDKYPTYDNYDAINVDKVVEIPKDYDGVMGVPITFLGSYNPEQFEIVKFRKGNDDKDLTVSGKQPYFRILIKRKDES